MNQAAKDTVTASQPSRSLRRKELKRIKSRAMDHPIITAPSTALTNDMYAAAFGLDAGLTRPDEKKRKLKKCCVEVGRTTKVAPNTRTHMTAVTSQRCQKRKRSVIDTPKGG
jgi:hypothetical protein